MIKRMVVSEREIDERATNKTELMYDVLLTYVSESATKLEELAYAEA